MGHPKLWEQRLGKEFIRANNHTMDTGDVPAGVRALREKKVIHGIFHDVEVPASVKKDMNT